MIDAHPDLAGRLALAKRLTADSTKEQSSAGLDTLTDDERARFTRLNDAYRAKFGFPFIMAIKGRSKDEILSAFTRRLENDDVTELATALAEIDRIARLRLKEILP
jgi:OHCU decarboxylase